MKNGRIIIFLFLLLLCGLSGCIHLINTQERQACLSATHFSNNSLPSCSTQKTCYNEVEDLDFIEAETTIFINNDLIYYKNELANIYFNFNKSTTILEKINKECNKEIPTNLIENINEFFYYSGQIFRNIDELSEKSIFILKDWLIYLEDQDINLIAEEEIYLDFILINENLNELKDEKNINSNYISKLKKEIKEMHEISENFGFEKTYMAEINNLDLLNYYLRFIGDAEPSKKPSLFNSYNYIVNTVSSLDDLRKANLNLQSADNYNFYIILDKLVGTKNSITTEFIELNNKINKDYIDLIKKIEEKEKYIIENKNNLTEDELYYFEIKKIDYFKKQITIGNYLFYLKNLENKIKINKNELEIENKELEKRLEECNKIIKNAKTFQNTYLQELIEKYNTNNNLEKIKVCKTIEELIMEDEKCFEKINAIFELNLNEFEEISLTNYKDLEKCTELLFMIEDKLNYNIYIQYLNNLILENNNKIKYIENELEKNNFEKLIKIEIIEKEIEELQQNKNIDNIFDIEKKIKKQEQNKIELIEISKEIINNFQERYTSIININNKTYLKITNPFNFEIENVTIDDDYENIKLISKEISKYKDKLKINQLNVNDNYFEIEYNNSKNMTQEIILLELEYAIIKLNIENQITNLYDKIQINNIIEISGDYETFDDKYIYFKTKKNNEIIYKKDIFNKTIISENIEGVNDEKYLIKNTYTIKNNWIEDVIWDIKLEQLENEVIIIKINTIESEIFEKNENKYYTLDIKKNNIKKIEEYRLKNKSQIYNEIEEIILKLNELKQSKYENIRLEAQKINLTNIKQEYNFAEIKVCYDNKNKIELLNDKETKFKIKEIELIKIYEKCKLKDIDEKTQLKIDEIYENRLIDIEKSLDLIKEIYFKLLEKEKEITTIEIEDVFTKIENLKELIKLIKTENTYLEEIKKIESEKDYTKLKSLEEKINIEIKKEADKILENIYILIQDNQSQELKELIHNINWVFEDFSLEELFSINYYPKINLKDVERIDKKQYFLDTITYKNEINKFIENYENEQFDQAIKKISDNTLLKINEIILEKKLLEEGYEAIKTDSRKELTNYINENEKEIETIQDLKNNYENGKYLNVIAKIRTKKTEKNTNLLYLIPISLLIIGVLIRTYYKLEEKEKRSKTTKKKKVIRHN